MLCGLPAKISSLHLLFILQHSEIPIPDHSGDLMYWITPMRRRCQIILDHHHAFTRQQMPVILYPVAGKKRKLPAQLLSGHIPLLQVLGDGPQSCAHLVNDCHSDCWVHVFNVFNYLKCFSGFARDTDGSLIFATQILMQFGYAVLFKKTPLCLTAISMPALLLARLIRVQIYTIHANSQQYTPI